MDGSPIELERLHKHWHGQLRADGQGGETGLNVPRSKTTIRQREPTVERVTSIVRTETRQVINHIDKGKKNALACCKQPNYCIQPYAHCCSGDSKSSHRNTHGHERKERHVKAVQNGATRQIWNKEHTCRHGSA